MYADKYANKKKINNYTPKNGNENGDKSKLTVFFTCRLIDTTFLLLLIFNIIIAFWICTNELSYGCYFY